MDARWKLWVEGPGDKALVQCLLRHLNVENVEPDCLKGGVNKIANMATQIRRSSGGGYRVAMILDANCDYRKRFEKVKSEINRLRLPIERCFLLPDDEHSGDLETLLERMFVPPHQVIYRCLDRYGECLRTHDTSYQPPVPKGRIYAYCEARGIELNASKRDYANPSHWNLDARELEPLKRFLTSLR